MRKDTPTKAVAPVDKGAQRIAEARKRLEERPKNTRLNSTVDKLDEVEKIKRLVQAKKQIERLKKLALRISEFYEHYQSKRFAKIFYFAPQLKDLHQACDDKSIVLDAPQESQLKTLNELIAIKEEKNRIVTLNTENPQEADTQLAALETIYFLNKKFNRDGSFKITVSKMPKTAADTEQKETDLTDHLSKVFSFTKILEFSNCIVSEEFVNMLLKAKRLANGNWQLNQIKLTQATISPQLLSRLKTLLPETSSAQITCMENQVIDGVLGTADGHLKVMTKKPQPELLHLLDTLSSNTFHSEEEGKDDSYHTVEFKDDSYSSDNLVASDRIVELKFSAQIIDSSFVDSLSKTLDALPNLKLLTFENLIFVDDEDESLKIRFLTTILRKKGLETLDIKGCGLTDQDLEFLCLPLKDHHSLLSLDISGNHFEKEIATLTDILKDNVLLQEIKCESKHRTQLLNNCLLRNKLFASYQASRHAQASTKEAQSLDQCIADTTFLIENLCLVTNTSTHYRRICESLKNLFELQAAQYQQKILHILDNISTSNTINDLRSCLSKRNDLETISTLVNLYVESPSTGIGFNYTARHEVLSKLKQIQLKLEKLVSLKNGEKPREISDSTEAKEDETSSHAQNGTSVNAPSTGAPSAQYLSDRAAIKIAVKLDGPLTQAFSSDHKHTKNKNRNGDATTELTELTITT